MLLAQLTRASSLNDVCDNAHIHQAKLNTLGVGAPSRNGLAHANKVRSSAMAEALFWGTLEHLTGLAKGFGGRTYKGLPRRIKKVIHVIDSSTIQLVANCLDWARHKRSKAGVKVHLRLNAAILPAQHGADRHGAPARQQIRPRAMRRRTPRRSGAVRQGLH